jgi:CheY-like chemotaxis protein/signal transduction histidine kinase/HAMP domain-containing protein
MRQKDKKERKTVSFFSSLSWTLILSFLLFTLIPMTLVSVMSYQKAYDIIKHETEMKLESTAKMKTREIKTYFDTLVTLFGLISETEGTTKFLHGLTSGYKVSGKSLLDFVKSYEWAMIVDKYADDLKGFQRSYNFYDVFLISNKGDILFTMAGEEDLGTNLFTGPFRSTKFAAACRRTVLTGERSFSDYERYAPSDNQVSGFLSAPIIDEEAERIGVVAFQIPIDHISQIMGDKLLLGKTAETYLLGTDLTLRSVLRMDKNEGLIDNQILTEQTKVLKRHLEEGNQIDERVEDVLFYDGPHGEEVLGIHIGFQIQNVTYSVITEIEQAEAFAAAWDLRKQTQLMVIMAGIVALFFVFLLVRQIVKPVEQLSDAVEKVKNGDLSEFPEIQSNNEIGSLGRAFSAMVATLNENHKENQLKEWLQNGQMELNKVMRENYDLAEFCRKVVTFLANYLGADIGAVYITDKKNHLELTGSYAFPSRKHQKNEFDFGQGVVGQAALEQQQILLTSVPEDYVVVRSGLGESRPRAIVVKPLVRDNLVVGVIELGSLTSFSENALNFLDVVEGHIAVTIQTILGHVRVQELLQQSQTQTEELAAQQEELRQTNEELEEQKNFLNSQNVILDQARKEVEQKVDELAAASRYKSEFLANMSHELRTPLNSILILSKHLSNNKDEDMTEKQVECAATVHSSGTELLNLINEILDLAKVESGKMILELDDCFIEDITGAMERNFQPVADSKRVGYIVKIAANMPKVFCTDCQRLSQIIKNLLSNAFKFTSKGSVTFEICMRDGDLPVTFMVKDSGIGISDENIEAIFRAFQQEDGSTSRKYGGTGLGLSISKELAGLLGGSLEATSVLGHGSVFTLSLPESIDAEKMEQPSKEAVSPSGPSASMKRNVNTPEEPVLSEQVAKAREYVSDDRKKVTKESRSILIIEDDLNFAKILRDTAREKGFMVLVAESGETGLHMTELYEPDGIIMDMELPGMDGKAILFRLKDNLNTRHIPVHIISATDKTIEPMHMGAVGSITKPVSMEAMNTVFSRIERVLSKEMKKILVIEDNKVMQQEITALIGNGIVKTTSATTGAEAKAFLEQEDFDCIILDLGLPDMAGVELLKELKKEENFYTPVIIHTARELTAEERQMLDSLADSIVVKDVKSMDKLLDESSLFIHRVAADLPEEKKEMIRRIHDREAILENKKILIVDDDMRNVFSLVSILEDKGINTVIAENGSVALTKLQENPDIDLVLMDIMMPEMDGYEAMKEIRKMDSKLAKVGIIALTAKAMKGDRAKCIEAGASDYLAKPVDADKLFSILRVWLY